MVSTDGNWQFNFKRNLSSLEVNTFAELMLRIGSNPPDLDNLPDTRDGPCTAPASSVLNRYMQNWLKILVFQTFPMPLFGRKLSLQKSTS